MRILQLCKKFPYPPKDGESIAVTYLSRAMAQQGCDITLLSMNTSKHYIDLDKLPDTFNHYSKIYTVPLDNSIKAWDALINLFSKKSFHVSRFESSAFSKKLIEILKDGHFDIIQLETLYLAPYLDIIKKHSNALVVMRAHNVEHEIWERLQKNVRSLPKRWYLKYLTSKLKRFEVNKLNDYDFLVPISDADLIKFRNLGYANGAHTIPIGLDLEQYSPKPLTIDKKISMAFIGSLDWLPNLEGISWFINDIWPRLSQRFPNLELHIAGRKAPSGFEKHQTKNLFIHGEVSDARDYINDHQIMLVPLLSGSGMRAKILEGMALGRVVISTRLGLEGIEAGVGSDVLVADTADEFIQVMENLMQSKDNFHDISESAINYVSTYFDNHDLAEDLRKAIDSYKNKSKYPNLKLENKEA